MDLKYSFLIKNATDHLKTASDGYEKLDTETIAWVLSTVIPHLTCSEILDDINKTLKTIEQ